MGTINDLLKEVEALRDKMSNVAHHRGYTNTESIIMSQKLDKLLNKYYKQKEKKP